MRGDRASSPRRETSIISSSHVHIHVPHVTCSSSNSSRPVARARAREGHMGHMDDWTTMGDERRAEAKAPAFTRVAHSCQCQQLRCTHEDTSIPAPSRGRGQG